ncbi:hypothetical protein EJV46_05945 [Roseococcus sp. SYP-B2431]|uniref:hypothetical protein n=1 Tax=Roseococcus sp. SYP-B2431 TaxID=2496640 RepID=UPI00103FDBED|nr:hypothetical protein [Roseococcus sp. SYP-B2431]TCI00187.1 hypothetical protein EJV46_05945 [Roseococcus sp. SYP-B2431]
MSDRFLDDRRSGLEEAFFAQQNEELRRRIADAGAQSDRRAALAAASHIQDPAVLDRLLQLGLSAGTLSALTLVPLVLVAWADGDLSDLERNAVMEAAATEGIHQDHPSHALLEGWLRVKPGPQLVAAWKDYVRALAQPLDLEARRQLEVQVMDKARQVADAAGGFLGLTSRISVAEREMLSDLSAAFHPQA